MLELGGYIQGSRSLRIKPAPLHIMLGRCVPVMFWVV